MRKAIAIDFDGCLCTDAYPEIGEPNWPVIRRASLAHTWQRWRGDGQLYRLIIPIF